jgi:hypothetical protein
MEPDRALICSRLRKRKKHVFQLAGANSAVLFFGREISLAASHLVNSLDLKTVSRRSMIQPFWSS